MRLLNEKQVKKLKNDGFLIIENIFTEKEVNDLKKLANNFCQITNYTGSPIGDAMSLGGFSEFLLDDRFVNIAKDILGDEIIYFGDSALHCKPNNRVFHKDSRSDIWDPSSTEYPIYRMGIFFQDHSVHSGGIKFRQGSHKRLNFGSNFYKNLFKSLIKLFIGKIRLKSLLNFGKIINAKSKIGDVVIWNLRTDHSGGAVILKKNPDNAMLPSEDDKIKPEDKFPEHNTRLAIFCAYAAPHKATEAYILNKANNPLYENHWKAVKYDNKNIREMANKKGVKLDFRGIKKYRSLDR
jgi:hypothetical protein